MSVITTRVAIVATVIVVCAVVLQAISFKSARPK